MDNIASDAELEAGRGYEALFVPALFAPWTKYLIDGAGVKPGSSVLDVACGTGVLARQANHASGRSGRVVGLDPAPGMIANARLNEPEIEWVLGPAEALSFANGEFDCVVSQFGLMFFQDLQKSADEMFRVLKPEGRLGVAVWDSIANNPAYEAVISLLDSEVSKAAGNAVRLPYRLGDGTDVISALVQAGFSDVTSETRREQGRFPDARTMVEAELRGWLPLFDIHLPEDHIENVLSKADNAMSAFCTSSGEIVFPTSAHIVTGNKPK